MGFLPDVAVWKLDCIPALSRGCDKAKPRAEALKPQGQLLPCPSCLGLKGCLQT